MPPSDEQRAGLRTPQFRLRTLMIVVSLVCLSLAAAKFLSPLVITALVLLLLTIGAHVAGNAIGTQLRDHGSQPLPGDAAASAAERPHRRLSDSDFAPASRLSQRETLGFIIIPCVVVGAVAGALGGGYWLVQVLEHKFTLPKLALGVAASSVLGGILGFLVSTFLKVLIAANVDAWRER